MNYFFGSLVAPFLWIQICFGFVGECLNSVVGHMCLLETSLLGVFLPPLVLVVVFGGVDGG